MDTSNIFCYWPCDGNTSPRGVCPGEVQYSETNMSGGTHTTQRQVYGIGCGSPQRPDISTCIDVVNDKRDVWDETALPPLNAFTELYYTVPSENCTSSFHGMKY